MTDTVPQKSDCTDLTDEQSFRLIVESLAEFRSENEQRKFPRFPTPAAISDKLGIHGFEGSLVVDDADPCNGSAPNCEKTDNNGDFGNRVLGINIVDFSETGVQLQFRCDDVLRLKESHLYLQLQGQSIPVSLKWFEHTGSINTGGFSFITDIDSDQYLARIISILNTELVDFTVNTHDGYPQISNEQFGVFLYLSIYYGLRLRLMETIAGINSLHLRDPSDCLSTTEKCNSHISLSFPYTSTYNIEQAIKHRSDNRAKKHLHKYIRPFYEFGCGIKGINKNILFLKEDVWTTILNSVFIAEEDFTYSSTILSSLSFLYQSFLHLKQLLPGLFEEEEFDNQFRYYSSIILKLDRLREKLQTRLVPTENTFLAPASML